MPIRPHEIEPGQSLFDQFAQAAANVCSRAPFFVASVASVAIWAPTLLLIRSVDTWQLVMGTYTGIVTFLLVALLQNSERRSEQAIQLKLNALAEGLADLMEYHSGDTGSLQDDINELKQAVGLEHHT